MADGLDPELKRLLAQAVGQAPTAVPRGAVPATHQTVNPAVVPVDDSNEEDDPEPDDRLVSDVAFRLQNMITDLTTEKPDLRALIRGAIVSTNHDLSTSVVDDLVDAIVQVI